MSIGITCKESIDIGDFKVTKIAAQRRKRHTARSMSVGYWSDTETAPKRVAKRREKVVADK